MKEKSTPALRRRKKTLIKELPPFKNILRGSLIERYKRCGKHGCKCAQSKGHGPKYYLSVSKPKQKPKMDYVPLRHFGDVHWFIGNFFSIQA